MKVVFPLWLSVSSSCNCSMRDSKDLKDAFVCMQGAVGQAHACTLFMVREEQLSSSHRGHCGKHPLTLTNDSKLSMTAKVSVRYNNTREIDRQSTLFTDEARKTTD